MLYKKEYIEILNKNIKKYRIIIYILIGLFVVTNALSFIFMQESAMTLFKWLLSIIDILIISSILTFWLFYLNNNKRLLKHYNLILNNKGKEIIATIQNIKSEFETLANNDEVYLIETKENKDKRIIYLLNGFDYSKLEIGKTYKFTIINNFIKEYEYYEA